ncbi:MAG: tRNA (guanine-N2)-dimethyltransferase [Candidatus Hecatellales archaeon B24]|nr:MAG: tRNA (guanine-N2)-dimethyltransferase [Candidatus Hecatellales archaeon B24]
MKLFTVLSGEHPTLPAAEVRAILEAESMPYREVEEFPCLLKFEASRKALEAVKLRAAYSRLCGMEIFSCKAEAGEILERCRETSFEDFISPGESFAVRVRRICGAEKVEKPLELEREIGAMIWRRVKGVKVDLKRPEKLFIGLTLKNGDFLFGVSLWQIPFKDFSARKPARKPFSHPSTLQPKFARCMVNLSRVKRGGVLYDPFCGAGTILVEAGLIGVKPLGGDLQTGMVMGARENLLHYRAGSPLLMVADALHPPVRLVDAIATDPPYGRSASTAGRRFEELLEGFLNASAEILSDGGFLCMASPLEAGVPAMAESLGFKTVEKHAIHIHRSLTRLVVVLRLK